MVIGNRKLQKLMRERFSGFIPRTVESNVVLYTVVTIRIYARSGTLYRLQSEVSESDKRSRAIQVELKFINLLSTFCSEVALRVRQSGKC